jgi:hypothetical protein
MPVGGGDDEVDSSDDSNDRIFDFTVAASSGGPTGPTVRNKTAQGGDAPAAATLGTDSPEVVCLCGKPAPHVAGKLDKGVYTAWRQFTCAERELPQDLRPYVATIGRSGCVMRPGALALVAKKDARLAWLRTTAGIENEEHLKLFCEILMSQGRKKRTAEGAGACGNGAKRRSDGAEPASSGAPAPGEAEREPEAEAAAQPAVAAGSANSVAQKVQKGRCGKKHATLLPCHVCCVGDSPNECVFKGRRDEETGKLAKCASMAASNPQPATRVTDEEAARRIVRCVGEALLLQLEGMLRAVEVHGAPIRIRRPEARSREVCDACWTTIVTLRFVASHPVTFCARATARTGLQVVLPDVRPPNLPAVSERRPEPCCRRMCRRCRYRFCLRSVAYVLSDASALCSDEHEKGTFDRAKTHAAFAGAAGRREGTGILSPSRRQGDARQRAAVARAMPVAPRVNRPAAAHSGSGLCQWENRPMGAGRLTWPGAAGRH